MPEYYGIVFYHKIKIEIFKIMSNRPFDKIELSPSNTAKCRLCNKKIKEDVFRVGIHDHIMGKGQSLVWGCEYYHKSCVDADSENGSHTREKLFLERKYDKQRTDNELASAKQIRQDIIDERRDLWEALRTAAWNDERHKISEKALDDLVARLPCNEKELLQVHGFGPTRSSHFGPIILEIIASYKNKLREKASTPNTLLESSRSPSCVTNLDSASAQHGPEDQDEVIIELSVDEITEKRGEINSRKTSKLNNLSEHFLSATKLNSEIAHHGPDDQDEVIIESEISVKERVRRIIREAEDSGEIIDFCNAAS